MINRKIRNTILSPCLHIICIMELVLFLKLLNIYLHDAILPLIVSKEHSISTIYIPESTLLTFHRSRWTFKYYRCRHDDASD